MRRPSWPSLGAAEEQEKERQRKERLRQRAHDPRQPIDVRRRTFNRLERSAVLPTRVRVFERDGWRCVRCGVQVFLLEEPKATVDHRIPMAQGGRNSSSNLQTMCGACNGWKRDSLAATQEEAQVAELLSARSETGYIYGTVLRLGRSAAGEAWLYWPDEYREAEPSYHRQRDPAKDPAGPMQVRLQLLTGWDRLATKMRLLLRAPGQPEVESAVGENDCE